VSDPLIGKQIGPFKVLRQLGRGGMGTVYEVRLPDDPRAFAAKLLQAVTSEASRERFRREGEVVARLKHPGIVTIHSAGELPGGVPYLVFELVRGTSLREILHRGPLSEERALSLGVQIAQALGYAHAQGVIHRDVKPDNVLVDGKDRARLADFGIALAVDQERMTRTGQLAGTPSYLAPEQLGATGTISPRTDVHAMGVLLFEMLTGELPFSEGVDLFAQIIRHRPSSVRELRPEVSQAMAKVVACCLEKDPDARFPDGDALAESLELAARGEVLVPDRPRSALAPLAVLAAIALVTMLGVVGWASLRPVPGAPADVAGSSPDAPAGVDATAPEEPAAPACRLGIREGEAFDAVVGWERGGQLPFEITYTFRCVVQVLNERELKMESTITDFKGPGAKRLIDELRGIVVRWVLDPRSGKVKSVSGMGVLRNVWLGGDSARMGMMTAILESIVTREFMTKSGNILFYLLPPPGQEETTAWQLPYETGDPGEERVRELALEGDLDGDARLMVTVPGEGDDPPDLTGVATWREGRLVEGEFKEVGEGAFVGEIVYRWSREVPEAPPEAR
jgi:hypothetical protein